MLRVGFLASHGGSGMRASLDGIRAGVIRAEASVVISNNSTAPALGIARQVGLPCYHLSAATNPVPEDLDATIRDTLHRHATDIVLLSGYMKQVGPLTLERFRSRILNTHPGLLPRFGGKGMYGDQVHRAVLAEGVPVTGATLHVVDGTYDHGPLLRQRKVPVLAGDTVETLRERVQAAECLLIVGVLADLAAGRLHLPLAAS